MEATATWAEDEVFDSVDDNVQYLPVRPPGQAPGPARPLHVPALVRRLDLLPLPHRTLPDPGRRDADTRARRVAPGRRDSRGRATSTHCRPSKGALTDRRGIARQDVRPVRRRKPPGPLEGYDEGAANNYPSAPIWRSETLTPGRLRATAWSTGPTRPPHQRDRAVRPVQQHDRQQLAAPGPGRPGRRSPGGRRPWSRSGSAAAERSTSLINLDSAGEGSKSVLFDRDQVSAVELTVVNASDRMSCWQYVNADVLLLGIPLDDDLAERVRGMAAR